MRILLAILSIIACHAALGGNTGWAAEARLRATCICQGSLVLLGDIAEIDRADAARAGQLARIELFTAPIGNLVRKVRRREVQELLALRGISSSDCLVTGAEEIAISSGTVQPASFPEGSSPSAASLRAAEGRIRQFVLKHLETIGMKDSPEVELQVSRAASTTLARGGQLTVSGGKAPFTGKQNLTLTVKTETGIVHFNQEVEIAPRELVVMPVRTLRRGDVITASDVHLVPLAPGASARDAARKLDEVLGREVTRAMSSTQPVEPSSLRKPVLVRKGEIVTVWARSSGLSVRTSARSMEDGSDGDLIVVQSLLGKDRFSVHVSGIQEVQLYPSGIKIPAVPADQPAHAASK